MTGKTLTRMAIAEAVARETGIPRYKSAPLVDDVLAAIVDALVDEGHVKIQSFGVFSTQSKRSWIGRHMMTGEKLRIKARRVVTFQASKNLKSRVAQGNCLQSTADVQDAEQ